MATGAFIAYYRVSTDRQGRSGLGLDGQRHAVREFLNGGAWSLIAEFTEVEFGRRNDRPELAKALDLCRRKKAVLVFAKLDRLARNVHFISGLMEFGVEFRATDMPEANRLTLHIMAAMAEHEARAISERTRAALQAARARGRKLGWSIPGRRQEQAQASLQGALRNRQEADRFASNVLPVILDIERAGIRTLQGIADALNARGVRTARGGRWYPTTVKNIAGRAASRVEQTAVG